VTICGHVAIDAPVARRVDTSTPDTPRSDPAPLVIRLVYFYDVLRRFNRTFQTRTFVRLLVFIVFVLLASSVGFWLSERGVEGNENLTYLDALWWSLVTMTTVGYGDYFPRTTIGRFLVGVPVMLIGGAVLGYAISIITTFLMDAKTRELRGMNKINLEGHTLIINYPGEAKLVELVEELRQDDKKGAVVLVTDRLETLPSNLAERDVHFVSGSPINADVLTRAAIVRARDAIVLAPNAGDENSDSTNLGVIVSLKDANDGLRITVECVNYSRRDLMRKAGADHVICVTELDVELLVQASHGLPIQEFIRDLATSLTPNRLDAVAFEAGGHDTVRFGDVLAQMADEDLLLVGVLDGEMPRVNPGRDTPVPDGARLLVISAKRPATYRYRGG